MLDTRQNQSEHIESNQQLEEEQEEQEEQEVEYAELVKAELLTQYREMCQQANIEAHEAFCAYLEETYDENDSIDIQI
jgi:hypothetical protein